MSHNIATINDRAAMAYQGETPWHQLGERMTAETAANLDAVMAAASLDYRVSLEPMFLGNGHQVPGRQAVVRDGGAVLGTVSDWYRPLQNVDAFNIFRPAMDEFGLTVEAAGALGQGEKAWMLFKLPTQPLCPVTRCAATVWPSPATTALRRPSSGPHRSGWSARTR